MVVTITRRKKVIGGLAASPNPTHYHPSRLIMTEAPRLPQTIQHCIWLLGQNWAVRGLESYNLPYSPIGVEP